jgi:hypothetical protein
MSITTDLKTYADIAAQAAQTRFGSAAAEAAGLLEKIRDSANGMIDSAEKAIDRAQGEAMVIRGRANGALGNVRTRGEGLKSASPLPLMRVTVGSTVEPYVEQAKALGASIGDMAEKFLASLQSDPRMAKLVGAAGEAVTSAETALTDVQKDPRVEKLVSRAETLVETVQDKVVKPALTLAGRAEEKASASVVPIKSAPTASVTSIAAGTAKPATRRTATAKTSTAKPSTAKTATAKTAVAKPAARATKAATAKTATAKTAATKTPTATAKSPTARAATAKSATAKAGTAKAGTAKAGTAKPAVRKPAAPKATPKTGGDATS